MGIEETVIAYRSRAAVAEAHSECQKRHGTRT